MIEARRIFCIAALPLVCSMQLAHAATKIEEQCAGEIKETDPAERQLLLVKCVSSALESQPGLKRPQVAHYIDDFRIENVNSVGGVEPVIAFVNPNRASAIKYIRVQAVIHNAVGDVVRSTIGDKTTARLQFTGPLEASDGVRYAEWEPAWYNHSAECMRITGVSVEFMNGRKLAFSGKALAAALAPGLQNDCSVKSK